MGDFCTREVLYTICVSKQINLLETVWTLNCHSLLSSDPLHKNQAYTNIQSQQTLIFGLRINLEVDWYHDS